MNQGQVLRFLPDVIRRTHEKETPLDALVEAMVSLLDPVDLRFSQLERYFDPYQAPTAMLPYLARWVDLGWLPVREREDGEGLPPERLRRLIALAPAIARRRGTAGALEQLLAAGLDVTNVRVVDRTRDPTISRPFHFVVRLPSAASGDRRLAELIVRFEKPVHLTHEIVFVDHL